MHFNLLENTQDVNKKAQLEQLYVDYLEGMVPYVPYLKEKNLSALAKNEVHRMIEDEHTYVFIFCAENGVIGFAIIGESPNSYSVDDIFIQDFYVVPKYRGIGVGENAVYRLCEMFDNKDISMYIPEENFPARIFWRGTLANIGYQDLVRQGRIKPLPPSDEVAPYLNYYYWAKG